MKQLFVLILAFAAIACGEKKNENPEVLPNGAPINNTPVKAQPESTVAKPVPYDSLHKKDTIRKP